MDAVTKFDDTVGAAGTDAGADLVWVGSIVTGQLVTSGDNPAYQGGMGLTGSAEMVLGPARVNDYLTVLPQTLGVEKHVVGLDIAREITRFFSGFASTLSSIMDIVLETLKVVGEALEKAAKYIGTAATSVACLLYGLSAVPKVIKAVNALTILKQLEDAGNQFSELKEIYENHGDELKVAAPELYAKIEDVVEGWTQDIIDNGMKELKENGITSVVTVVLSVLAIVATILVAVCTSGVGMIVGAVIGAVVCLSVTAVDIKGWISALKEAKKLDDKEIAMNVVSIVIGIVSLVVSVFFAPTLALAAIGGVLCALMIAIPTINLIYLKVKEEEAKAAQIEES